MKPYSGYYLQPRPDTDSLLTDVNPGSPCGEYLRRYWQHERSVREHGATEARVYDAIRLGAVIKSLSIVI